MYRQGLSGLGLAAMLTLGVLAVRAETKSTAVPDCPIDGNRIDFLVHTDTVDGPVYFCSGGCIKTYNANPSDYAKLVANQRDVLAKRDKVQVKCPVSVEASDPQITTTHNGEIVSFCSDQCAKRFTADPARYKSRLAQSYSYQTKCPVMGGRITSKGSTTLATGETIYYCCGGCDKKFLGDLAKYAPKLTAQGINLDVPKIQKMLKGGARK